MPVAVPGRRDLVYEFVARRYAETGVPPSMREVTIGLGLSSPSTAHYHLGQLVRDGKLRKVRRQYVPTDAVTAPIAGFPEGVINAACPWEGTAHDFDVMAGPEPIIFCRKCGAARRLVAA